MDLSGLHYSVGEPFLGLLHDHGVCCWCIKSIEQRSYTRTCKLNVTFCVFGYPILPALDYLVDKNCDCDIFNTFLAMLNFCYTYHECVFRTNLPKKNGRRTRTDRHGQALQLCHFHW